MEFTKLSQATILCITTAIPGLADAKISIECTLRTPYSQQPLPETKQPNNCDVNKNGKVEPSDALRVLNALNTFGPSVITDQTRSSDVNNDGLLTPLDALMVVHELNQQIARISPTNK